MKKLPTPKNRASVLPLDLQMIVRACHADNLDSEALFMEFAAFDALVLKALNDRGHDHGDDLRDLLPRDETRTRGYRLAVAALEHYFASGQSGDKFTTPGEAAKEVMAAITDKAQDAAFGLGLCLGYRMTRAAGGAR